MAKGQARASTPMAILATTAIGALMYLIVTMFVPFIGGTVETTVASTPCLSCWGWGGAGACAAAGRGVGNETRSWNASCNPALATASPSTQWTTIAGFLQIAAIFAVMALVFMFLRGMI